MNKIAIPGAIAVCLLFISTFVISLTDLLFLNQVSSFLSPILGDSTMRGGYLDATESLLSGTWGKVGVMEQSKTFYLRIFIMYAPVIYWGQKVMLQYQSGKFLYNLFVIGAIFNPLFVLIEIFNRISGSLVFFFCIIGGVFYFKTIRNKVIPKWISILSMISLVFAIYPYISDIFSREENFMMFIWDAKGRHYLP